MNALSRRLVLAGLAALPLASSALAQETLKIIYPYPAGGSGDAVARIIAEQLQRTLARPVIVENKTGAGGRIGAQAVKDASPDGTTLLFGTTGQMTFAPQITPNIGYDPFKDFVPISEVASSEIVLAAGSKVPATSLAELAAWVKANPEMGVYATPGASTSAHFTGAEFGRVFGLDLRHVAYRGAPAALPDVLAGRIPILVAIGAELMEQHKSGGIRILATAGAARSPFLPNTPTLKEAGIDVEAPNGFAFYAPAHMSTQLLERFEKEIRSATQLAEVKEKIRSLGFLPTGTSAKQLEELQRTQFERWTAAIKASGFKVE